MAGVDMEKLSRQPNTFAPTNRLLACSRRGDADMHLELGSALCYPVIWVYLTSSRVPYVKRV
jgi:hypothetical protein